MVKRSYTSRLQKGGALLDDMRLLVRSWTEEASWDEQRQQVIVENVLGKNTKIRSNHIFGYAFSQRFLKGNPPEAWKIVRPLEDKELPLEIIRPIYYWITARSDLLIYDFVVDEILGKSKSADLSVRMDETKKWIIKKIAEQNQIWSEAVAVRVARGLLAALRDFGVLEGSIRKRIAPAYLPIESFVYLAFCLHSLGSSGAGLVRHNDWKLFLMKPPVVEALLLEAHQNKFLHYEAAGRIYRIEYFVDNTKELADVFDRRRN